MDEQQYTKPALDKFRQWHFWWLVVFSFLLIIIFVYYLPTMFLNQSMAPHDASMGMPVDESQPHGHEEDEMMTDEHMQEQMDGAMTKEEMDQHMMENGEMMPEDHGSAVYHEEGQVKEGLVVNLNISSVPYNVGVPLSMNFFVNQKLGNLPAGQAGIPVLANQLEIKHTKQMHVIGVRSDMNEFFHIHPDFLVNSPSVFSIDYIFNKPGSYKIWSEIKSGGVNYSFGHPEVNINGRDLKEEKKVSFSRNVMFGQYQVSLKASDTFVKGREVDLSFDIHSLTGMEIEVEQYLGADMHLSIISDDWKQFIHTHPEGYVHSRAPSLINSALAHGGVEDEPAGATDEHQTTSSGDEVISFHVTFPEVGLYKVFAQFRPKGIDLLADKALLAEFWIQVEEKVALPISQWRMLLFVSVILIAVLSWRINRYLKVKPEDV